jgi:hypothetical protein
MRCKNVFEQIRKHHRARDACGHHPMLIANAGINSAIRNDAKDCRVGTGYCSCRITSEWLGVGG